MAFQDRIVQHPNRWKLTEVGDPSNVTTYDVERVEGDVTAPGTPLNAASLNAEIAAAAAAEMAALHLSGGGYVLNNGQPYTNFDGNCITSGSVFVARYGDLCIVEGNLTPTGALTAAAKILSETKIPPRAYGGTKWINASNSNRPNVTAKNALAVAIDQAGGLQINYGGAYRYDFQYIYIANWDDF